MASDVWKHYRLLIGFRLSPGGAAVSASTYAQLSIANTVAKGNVLTWIAGKRYIPLQKSPRKDKSVGYPPGDGNSLGVAERFP